MEQSTQLVVQLRKAERMSRINELTPSISTTNRRSAKLITGINELKIFEMSYHTDLVGISS